MDAEDIKYNENVINWLNGLVDYDPKEHKVKEAYYALQTCLPPCRGLVVAIITVNDKYAIIFSLAGKFAKVYFPKKIETSFMDYNTDNKYMFAARVDDLFWMYDERLRTSVIGAQQFTNFGMDMTMPFLEQQDFRLLE